MPIRSVELNGADHVLMGEERSRIYPEASSLGWQLLIGGVGNQACGAATLAAVDRGGAGMVRIAWCTLESLSSFFRRGVLRGVRNMIMLRPSRFGDCWISAFSSKSFAMRRNKTSARAVC